MLRVTVELISAVTGNTSKLATAYISNDGKGTRESGNYDVRIMRKGNNSPTGKPTREGHVEGFPRFSYSVWRLVSRCLLAAFPEENTAVLAVQGKPRLDARVMEGLREFVYSLDGEEHAITPTMAAAEMWLNAGNIEPELKATEALGCDLPAGDVREGLQCSVFRGLKLLAASQPLQLFTDEERADIDNARRFVNALPVV